MRLPTANMKMKYFSLMFLLACCAGALNADAALYQYNFNSGFANGQDVPDGNPAGWSDTRTISGQTENIITDVNVRLNITGGYNGDLYIYLVHSSGFAVLLNRSGRTVSDPFGNSGSGFNVILDDSAGTDVHDYVYNVNPQTYQADGRNVDPATTLDTDTRSAYLSAFNGLDANGTWTLFVADMSGGDLTESHIVSWQLDITAVPEPVHVALGIFGSLCATVGGVRLWKRRQRGRPRRFHP